MTVEELRKIIARGETLCVEFKSDRDKLSDRALVGESACGAAKGITLCQIDTQVTFGFVKIRENSRKYA